jgi:bacteriorhodopsin
MSVICVFINLVASIAYFGRVIANVQCSPGFLVVTTYRYCDYLATCPFLVIDLLWNLEAPYKWCVSSPPLPSRPHAVIALAISFDDAFFS